MYPAYPPRFGCGLLRGRRCATGAGGFVAVGAEGAGASSPPPTADHMSAAAASAAILRGVAAGSGDDCSGGHGDELCRLARRRRRDRRRLGDYAGSGSTWGGMALCAGRRDPDGRVGRRRRCARRRRSRRRSRRLRHRSRRSRSSPRSRHSRRRSRRRRAAWAVRRWSAGGRHRVPPTAIAPRRGRLPVTARRHSGWRSRRLWPRWRRQRPQLRLAAAAAARRLARTKVTPRRDHRPEVTPRRDHRRSPGCGGTGGEL